MDYGSNGPNASFDKREKNCSSQASGLSREKLDNLNFMTHNRLPLMSASKNGLELGQSRNVFNAAAHEVGSDQYKNSPMVRMAQTREGRASQKRSASYRFASIGELNPPIP